MYIFKGIIAVKYIFSYFLEHFSMVFRAFKSGP